MKLSRIQKKNKDKIICPKCSEKLSGKVEFAQNGQFIVCPNCKGSF